MHTEAVAPATQKCLKLLATQDWLKRFYLAGGTGLAMHLGHRLSEDLDFFSGQQVDPKDLRTRLAPLGKLKIEMEKEGTLWATLNGTKLSFFQYEYPLLDSVENFEGVAVAGIRDIASMKLDALSSRGSKKDFVDLYFILKEGRSLQDILQWFHEKFRGIDYNKGHLLKSLAYFEDAEKEKDPHMLKKFSWPEVRTFFQHQATKII